MTLTKEQRDAIIDECEDKCCELYGDFGHEIWYDIYDGVCKVSTRLDVLATHKKVRELVTLTKDEWLQVTTSEELFKFVHKTIMEI